MHYCEIHNMRKRVDIVDYTPYKNLIHVFSGNTKKEKIIIWEARTEHCPYNIAYHYSNNSFEKLGDLKVNSLKHYSVFPLEILQVEKTEKLIILKFKDKVNYRACFRSGNDPYKFDSLKYIFNTSTNTLEIDKYK